MSPHKSVLLFFHHKKRNIWIEWGLPLQLKGSICKEEQTYLFILYPKSIFSLLLCCANDGISPRFPIALPILYTISKAISVGTKPTARNMPTSPGFIEWVEQLGSAERFR